MREVRSVGRAGTPHRRNGRAWCARRLLGPPHLHSRYGPLVDCYFKALSPYYRTD